QVGRHLLPRLAAVAAAQQDLGGVIEHLRVVGGGEDRRVPLEAVLQVGGRASVGELRPGHDVAHLARAVVVAGDLASVLARVDDVRILGVGGHPAALAAAGRVPVAGLDPVAGDAAGNADVGVVLRRAIEPVGEAVVHRHAVELRGRLVVLRGPGPAAVVGDGGAAVVAEDHPAGIVRIDPQVVVVAVRHGQVREALPAVGRLVHVDVGQVDRVGVLRVGVDPRVVPRALADLVLVVDVGPLLAVVLAAEEAAVLRLDEGEYAPGQGRRGGHADLSPDPFRQPLG